MEQPADRSTASNSFHKVHYDFKQLPFHTSPWRQLNLQGVAIGLIHLPPNEGYTFMHSHTEQEEVYIVVEGKGLMAIEDQLLPLEPGDLVRISPHAKRALKADETSALFIICAGGVVAGYPKATNARYLIDDGVPHYDELPPWYQGNRAVEDRNAKLKARMQKSLKKRTQQQEE